MANPRWYKDAIVYELRVRSFADGDGDGIGDFRGLIERLGYLEDLGVTALWLLPFYPSPLRDDGYDISDYHAVHPECGTLDDFQRFLDEAHRRGMRVITELVLNHSSDQHPWFQRARRAPHDSPERAFYVWSDTPERFGEARIIFSDFEPSNWSWDPLARSYYWHRFYAHQPDLNYDNPAVREAMFEVMDFWLGMGVDGLRLDAVPYLFEREGTTCENLPETHALLRDLRGHIDARYQDRMLLAEANQWPEEAVAYFGQGDECHMAFHFPLMPRLFVAIHLEDRFPLVDILSEMPEIPSGCQWAIFLRNHDELTLEMVTDEERDAMVRAYAAEPVMRLNLGIRRRLAPLAGNDRRHIELMNALLFSLPGTPVVYYGDEIGMGDNVYLGDRNGVRTPMQWSADKNAGFSRANPQKLELPVIIDPEYHYEAINVETQQRSPSSLLWWMKRLIALRRRHASFGQGALTVLRADNPRIFAFARHDENETLLVVANLSRFMAFAEIDLSAWKGLVPVELFGRTALPVIGEAPYQLTLGGHGFLWLALTEPGKDVARAAAYEPPSVKIHAAWNAALARHEGADLANVITRWAAAQPWFGRSPRATSAKIVEVVPAGDPLEACVAILEVAGDEGEPARYFVPLGFATGDRALEIRARAPHAIVAWLRSPDGPEGALFDALADAPATTALLTALLSRKKTRGLGGDIVATQWPALRPPPSDETPISGVPASPPHGVVTLFGARFSLVVTRRLEDGPSPSLEMARFLEEHPGARVPRLAGAIEYAAPRRDPVALVVVRDHVPDDLDGLRHASSELHRFFERVLARVPEEPSPAPHPIDPLAAAAEEPPPEARDAIGAYLDAARLFGVRLGELHRALASDPSATAFAPEPFTPFDQRGLYQSLRSLAGRTLRELKSAMRGLPEETRAAAERVLAHEEELRRRQGALLGRRLGGVRVRTHGELDLRSLRVSGSDLILIDLEGDGMRSASERRRKASPLRDAAALVRSLHDVTLTVLLDPERVRPGDVPAARPWADAFFLWSSASLLKGYLAEAAELLPRAPDERAVLFDAFLMEHAFATLSRALTERDSGAALRALDLLGARLSDRASGTSLKEG